MNQNVQPNFYSIIPANTDSIYRSIVLRKSFYKELLKIKDKTGISFSRLINGVIKEFLEDYKNEF